MDAKRVIQAQYLAALDMLCDAVAQCPEELWDDPAYRNRFWQVAFHALFYVHLYLQPNLEAFKTWAKHRAGREQLDQPSQPYSVEEVLEYAGLCRDEVVKQVAQLEPDAPSGFHWLPFNKLELQFYNIRHLQQHIGELCERLGRVGEISVQWIGTKQA